MHVLQILVLAPVQRTARKHQVKCPFKIATSVFNLDKFYYSA